MPIGPNEAPVDAEVAWARTLERLADSSEVDSKHSVMPELAALDEPTRAGIVRRLAALRELRGAVALGLGPEPEPGLDDEAPPWSQLGRFTILKRLGRGGQGLVFLAHDPVLRRDVALKVPLPHVLASRSSRERFLREAQIGANLRHPHIVAVYDVGQVGEGCYIASEFCPGPNLAEWQTAATQPIDCTLAAEIVAQIASGAAEAHRHGIVHRDLKPANVLLAPLAPPADDAPRAPSALPFEPRIADFGLARLTDDEGGHTQTGGPLGTAAYMSPEQAQGHREHVGRPTDIYALGAMLYELLSGSTPHEGHSYADTLRRIVSEDPPPLRSLRRAVPRDLAAVCMKCLEKNPRRRYADAAELEADLRRFLHGEPTTARALGWARRGARWAARQPALAALSAVLLLCAITIVASSLWYSTQLTRLVADANREKERANEHAEYNERLLYGERLGAAAGAFFVGRADQAARILEPYAHERQFSHLQGPEWSLLHNLQRDHQLLAQHDSEGYCVALSPDGLLLASGSQDGALLLTEAATGRALGRLAGHSACVNELSFSPDGRSLASVGCDGNLFLWDVAARTGRLIAQSSQAMGCVEHSPDGRLLAVAGHEHGVQVYDTETWNAVSLGCENTSPHCVAWSPDGRLLMASVEQGESRIWSMPSREPLRTMPLVAYDAKFTPDGRSLILACGADLIAFDTRDWRETGRWRAGDGLLKGLAIRADDGQLATGGDESAVFCIDPSSIERGLPRAGHRRVVRDLVFSPEGDSLYTVGCDGAVLKWRVREGSWPMRLTPEVHATALFHSSVDGRELWEVDRRGRVWAWDLPTGALLWRREVEFEGPRPPRVQAIFGEEPQLLVLDEDQLRLIDAHSGKVLRRAALPGVDGAYVAASQRVLAFGGQGQQWLIERDFETVRRLPDVGYPHSHHCGLFVDDPPRYLSERDGALTFVDIERQRPIWTARVSGGRVVRHILADLFAVTSNTSQIRLLRAQDGADAVTLATDAGVESPLAFSADGTRMIIGCSEAIRFWDLETQRELLAIPTYGAMPSDLYLTHNDSYLVARMPIEGGAWFQVVVWPCETEARRVRQPRAPRILDTKGLSRSPAPRNRNRAAAKYWLRTDDDASR